MAGQLAEEIITISPTPKVRNKKKKRIRKSLENRTPHHFTVLGTGSSSSFPLLSFSNKKKRETKKKKNIKEAGFKTRSHLYK